MTHTGVERCPRCRRSFGGHFTFRRAHPSSRCRTIRDLRVIGLRANGDGVWHRPGPADPVQLSLFGPGRPRGTAGARAIFPRAQRAAQATRGRGDQERLFRLPEGAQGRAA
jgi:hypothetical protein